MKAYKTRKVLSAGDRYRRGKIIEIGRVEGNGVIIKVQYKTKIVEMIIY